jgi:transcriptional regulator with XRE-family HTH domain
LELDSKKLGHRLRELRVHRGLSLVDAAAAADMSPSFLSHIETGKGDITFLRMHRLVRAYGIGLMDLFPPAHELPEVVRAKERVPLRSSTEAISMYLLAPDTDRAMTPVLGKLEPGAAEAEFGHHSNELFIHVLRGALRIIFEGGREIELQAGDSAYLNSQEGRKTANASRGVTLTLGVALWPPRRKIGRGNGKKKSTSG